jgi:SAM-dependent methyltransferase
VTEAWQAAVIETAARRYRPCGRTPYHFARGKLSADPVYFALLRAGLVRDDARVLDLGCGQLLLAPLLDACRNLRDAGGWPADWPAPARPRSVHGIDLRRNVVAVAARALPDLATAEAADLRDATLPPNDFTLMLDVLHYIDEVAQEKLVARIAAALTPGGCFVTRVADTGAGLRYLVTRVGDQLITMLRGALWPRFHVRSLAGWRALLERHGFDVTMTPMSEGTPFANVMLVCRKPVLAAAVAPRAAVASS